MSRVFSGIQPTGEMHIGNYLGAVRFWVEDQDKDDAIFCVVDLHAMTTGHDASTFADRTLATAVLLMAAGLDPKRCLLFVQSHVPEHSELTWLLNNVATFGELNRMTQFKEKSEGRESVSVGLFDYPVLMAADILIYDTDRVPVGDDQRQHLELARDVAIRFNHRFGDTFVVPEPAIAKVGARIMDLQNPTAKMAKSSESPQGTVLLLDDDKTIAKKIKSAVTDSGRDVAYDLKDKPGIANLLSMFSAVTGRSIDDLVAEYGDSGYGTFKTAVADAVVEAISPVRDRYRELIADRADVERQLRESAERARSMAAPVLARAKKAMGLLL